VEGASEHYRVRRDGKSSHDHFGPFDQSVFDRYSIVDVTDLAEATRKIEARNQPSISVDETHTKLTHANVRGFMSFGQIVDSRRWGRSSVG
jgi:hypothetical protein